MKIVSALLFTLLTTAASTKAQALVGTNTSSTQQLRPGLAEPTTIRERFTGPPELPGRETTQPPVPTAPTTISDSFSDAGSVEDTADSSSEIKSTAFSGSNDEGSNTGMIGSSSNVHSVGSADEDYSIEYYPLSADDSYGSDSGSQMFITASSDSNVGSEGSSIRFIAFSMSASAAAIIVTALTLV